MIFIIGITIASFLFCLLLFKKKKEPADLLMIIWIGVINIHLILFYALKTGISYKYPYTLGLILPIPLLHPVLLYFYTIELTKKEALTFKKICLHLIPFFILTALAFPFFNLPQEEKINIFQHNGKGYEWYITIQVLVILISGFAYTIASLFEIRKHQKRLQQILSNTDKRMLKWLEYLTIGLGMIWLLTIFFDDDVILNAVVAFVLFIGFFGINQVPVFNRQWITDLNTEKSHNYDTTPDSEISDTLPPPSRYAKSGLKEDDISRIMSQLEELMKKDKPFTDSELTLNDLAQKLDVHPNQLSQAINSITGKSFYHYINSWRIEEFLALASLPENKKYTFLSLAYDCGFNSKTTFNKYFKLHTGKTPSEFIIA
jgi:AraC-like DNA-binding protein